MSYEVPGFKLGVLTANADLSTKQYYFAKVTGVNQVGLAAAATDQIVGVIQNKPVSGAAVELTVDGVTKVVASAAITAGDKVTSAADGRAVTTVVAGAGQAIALETATVAGQLIAILLIPSIK